MPDPTELLREAASRLRGIDDALSAEIERELDAPPLGSLECCLRYIAMLAEEGEGPAAGELRNILADQIKLLTDDEVVSLALRFEPHEWAKWNREHVELSDEQRQELFARMRKARERTVFNPPLRKIPTRSEALKMKLGDDQAALDRIALYDAVKGTADERAVWSTLSVKERAAIRFANSARPDDEPT
jgi:hypothetical protein